MSGEEAGGRRAQGGELQRLATGGEALRIRSSVTLGRAQAGPATENDGVTLWLCLQELSVKAGVPRPPPTHLSFSAPPVPGMPSMASSPGWPRLKAHGVCGEQSNTLHS